MALGPLPIVPSKTEKKEKKRTRASPSVTQGCVCVCVAWERNANGGGWACRFVLVPGVIMASEWEGGGGVGLRARIMASLVLLQWLCYVVHCHAAAKDQLMNEAFN